MTRYTFLKAIDRRCTGALCCLRDRCIHHALPTSNIKGLIWPVRTGEHCEHFRSSLSSCGDGGDHDGLD